jgi:hypothetical protein
LPSGSVSDFQRLLVRQSEQVLVEQLALMKLAWQLD